MADSGELSNEMPPPRLDAGAFVLRAISEADWPLEAELSRDDDVVRWTFYPARMDEDAARERIRGYERRAAEGASTRFEILDAQGDALGTCGLAGLQKGTLEVFYVLLPRGRGRGAATAATRALVDWALDSGRPQVALVTVEGNDRSEGVAVRAGFRPVARFEDDHRGRPATLTRWLVERRTR